MLKPLLFTTLILSTLSFGAMAEPRIGIDIDVAPGVSVHIGDRDSYGNYWDGRYWREPRWWGQHHGYYFGYRNEHGNYWDGRNWRDDKWWHKRYGNNNYYRHHDRDNHYHDNHHRNKKNKHNHRHDD